MSGLKFVVKKELSRLGKKSWILYDSYGVEIPAFSYYCKKTLDLALATRKRYAEVVAHFIEYLIVANVLGVSATRQHINKVLDAYPRVLEAGSSLLLSQIRAGANPEDAWLIPVLEALDIKPYANGSFMNTFPPINNFLKLSENLAAEAFEKASLLGLDHGNDYRVLFDLLDRCPQVSSIEVSNMRSNSMLGSVVRFRSSGVKPRRGMKGPKLPSDLDIECKAFPFEHVIALATAATTYRDRAFWLGLAASGLRSSELKSLKWNHIGIQTQEIFVMDPKGLRFGKDMKRQDILRFKGRATSFTYLIYQFKVAFFEALTLYLRHEYVPPRGPGPHYVFQYVEIGRRGQPYVDVSDTAILKSFRKCCERAEIPKPLNGEGWAPHSLRHMYAVYMHNDFPLPDGTFGLSLPEVRALIGHKDIVSTAIYAKQKRDRIRTKIQESDEILLADSLDIPALPLIAKK